MITFRFYVVSTTALFLALAVGILIGSALDESIVERLENRITSVDRRLDEVSAENDELRSTSKRMEELLASSSPHLVSGSLADERVLIVAERGVDPDHVRSLRELALVANAQAPGVLWLEKGWALADDDVRTSLAEDLDLTVTPAPTLRLRAWRLLLEQLIAPDADLTVVPSDPPGAEEELQESTTTHAVPATTLPDVPDVPEVPLDVLGVLDTRGLLSVEELGDETSTVRSVFGPGLIVIVVTGPQTDLREVGFTASLLSTNTDVGVLTVLAAVSRDEDPGPVLRAVLDDEVLRERIATVDNLQTSLGRVAALLAAADLRFSVIGHYGDLPDAERELPVWTARSAPAAE